MSPRGQCPARTHLRRQALVVNLAQTAPLAELFSSGYVQQMHLMLLTEGLHQFRVSGLVAVLCQAAKATLAAIECLGASSNGSARLPMNCGEEGKREVVVVVVGMRSAG